MFKAVQDIRGIFGAKRKRVFPVIFLRDDIYDFIRDADKNKWKDFQLGLEWNETKIKHLLAFRISRAFDPVGVPMSYDQAWSHLIEPGGVAMGSEKKRIIPTFDYIARSTHLRPRDFIRFLQVSAEEELKRGISPKIRRETLRQVDKAFSNYLKDEIVDEIYAILPEIPQILDIFSQIRKQTLSQELFRQMYKERALDEGFRVKDPDFVLRVLFHFSVIGNQPRQHTHTVFHYLNKDARINRYETIVIHRGLFKALGIV